MIGYLFLAALGIASIFLIKRRKDKTKFFEREFEHFWVFAKKELKGEERRLATLSHCHRSFKRLLERGEEEFVREALPRILKETKLKSKKFSGYYGNLYAGANSSFQALQASL